MAGCVSGDAPGGGREAVGSSSQAVHNSVVDMASYFPFAGWWGCSAVAIAPHLILTAGHCFTPANGGFGCGSWAGAAVSIPGPSGVIGDPGTVVVQSPAGNQNLAWHRSILDVSTCPSNFVCSPNVVSCAQAACPQTPPSGFANVQTWYGDMVAMFVEQEIPAAMIGQVIVHPSVASARPNFVADPGLEAWATASTPAVSIVGFGAGSPPLQRGYGRMRWVGNTLANQPLGWSSCTTSKGTGTVPQIILDANGFTFPDPPNGGNCDAWQFGTPFPGANGWALGGAGDSGGPVVIGGSAPAMGIPATQPPAPLDPAVPYVAGVLSTGSCSESRYAPTYPKETSDWLASVAKDSDGDGIPDQWDDCNGPGLDADGDKVCDGVDNCPKTFNPKQENCNREAENSRGAVALGDACDPVPCVVATPVKQSLQVPLCPFSPACTETTLATANNINLSPKPSKHVDGSGTTVNVPHATRHRYCIEGEFPVPGGGTTPTDCFGPSAVADAFSNTALVAEQADSRFFRVTIDGQSPNVSEVAPPGFGFPGLAFSTWDFAADFTRWSTVSPWGVAWVNPLFGAPKNNQKQSGRYWLHAATQAGQMQDVGTGIHPMLNGTPPESLSNNYVPLYPVVKSQGAPPVCVGTDCGQPGLIIREPILWDPFPPKGCLSCGLFRNSLLWRPGQLRLVAQGPSGPLGLLTPSGIVEQPETPFLSANLQALLAAPGHGYLAAVESDLRFGNGVANPQGIVWNQGLLSVVTGLNVVNGQAVSTQETRPPRVLASVSVSAATVPPMRSEAQALYSSAIGRAFVVGGRSGTTPLKDVWWTDASDDTGSWQQLGLTGPDLGKVIAATYAFRDDALWVLDEARGPFGLRRARLVRIDRTTGQTSVVGQWPRLGLFETWWLTMDRGGDLLLTATHGKGIGGHIIVRIELAASGPKVTGVLNDKGQLVLPPLADSTGYTLVEKAKKKAPLPYTLETTEELPMSPGTWALLGGCL